MQSRSPQSGSTVIETFEPRRLLSAGVLDPSFGIGGTITSDPFVFPNGQANAVATQANGDIVVAGFDVNPLAAPSAFDIARYLPSGQLDLSFAARGIARFPAITDRASAVAIQSNGDIVVAGGLSVVRLLPTGAADDSFGQSGIAALSPPVSWSGTQFTAVAVAANGTVYLGGYTSVSGGASRFALAQVNSAGKTASFYSYTFANRADVATSIGLSNGKIILGGYTTVADGTTDFGLMRVNSNGSLDTTFGTGGKTETDFQNQSDQIDAIALQSNGEIIAAGYANTTYLESPAETAPALDVALARYTTAGKLDTTFASGGKRITQTPFFSPNGEATYQAFATGVVIEKDNSIVIGGGALDSGGDDQMLAIHYSANGTFLASNSSGDDTGQSNLEMQGDFSIAYGIALENNQIVLAGSQDLEDSSYGDVTQDLAVVRLNANLTPDRTFAGSESIAISQDGSGAVAVGDPAGYLEGTYISPVVSAIQPDGKLLILGPGYGSGASDAAVTLARYNTDGSRDTSFTPPMGTAGTALAVLPNGQILIAGDTAFGFERLNSNGSIDSTFNPDDANPVDASAIAVETDGDILVAAGNALYRYLPNGNPDLGFGNGGATTGTDRTISAVAVQSNGDIVTVGGDVIDRFTASGLLDDGFNSSGSVTLTDANTDSDVASIVAIAQDGDILVGGENQIAALTPTGLLDPNFGTAGIATMVDLSVDTSSLLRIQAMTVEPDGRILVAGRIESGDLTPQPQELMRLTADGQADPAFGTDGYASNLLLGSELTNVIGIYVTPASKILLVGDVQPLQLQGALVTISQYLDAGSVSGTVYNDLNGDGVHQSIEPVIAHQLIYADLTNVGHYLPSDPSTYTDSSGNYTLNDLPSGFVILRQQLQTGQRQSAPSRGSGNHVTITTADLSNVDFAATTRTFISGTVFNDLNANGSQSSNEPTLAGWRVFIDANNDGIFESTEESVLTDASGDFSFNDLPAGNYTLRIMLPKGYVQTTSNKLKLTSGQVMQGIKLGVHKTA